MTAVMALAAVVLPIPISPIPTSSTPSRSSADATSLQRRWPESLSWTLGETPRRSDYRLHLGGAAAEMSFVVEADHEFPQVGLASMLAKYLREAFMERFNEYFARLAPGVAPTAGYVEDGRRWLEATRDARAAHGVADSELVRRA